MSRREGQRRRITLQGKRRTGRMTETKDLQQIKHFFLLLLLLLRSILLGLFLSSSSSSLFSCSSSLSNCNGSLSVPSVNVAGRDIFAIRMGMEKWLRSGSWTLNQRLPDRNWQSSTNRDKQVYKQINPQIVNRREEIFLSLAGVESSSRCRCCCLSSFFVRSLDERWERVCLSWLEECSFYFLPIAVGARCERFFWVVLVVRWRSVGDVLLPFVAKCWIVLLLDLWSSPRRSETRKTIVLPPLRWEKRNYPRTLERNKRVHQQHWRDILHTKHFLSLRSTSKWTNARAGNNEQRERERERENNFNTALMPRRERHSLSLTVARQPHISRRDDDQRKTDLDLPWDVRSSIALGEVLRCRVDLDDHLLRTILFPLLWTASDDDEADRWIGGNERETRRSDVLQWVFGRLRRDSGTSWSVLHSLAKLFRRRSEELVWEQQLLSLSFSSLWKERMWVARSSFWRGESPSVGASGSSEEWSICQRWLWIQLRWWTSETCLWTFVYSWQFDLWGRHSLSRARWMEFSTFSRWYWSKVISFSFVLDQLSQSQSVHSTRSEIRPISERNLANARWDLFFSFIEMSHSSHLGTSFERERENVPNVFRCWRIFSTCRCGWKWSCCCSSVDQSLSYSWDSSCSLAQCSSDVLVCLFSSLFSSCEGIEKEFHLHSTNVIECHEWSSFDLEWRGNGRSAARLRWETSIDFHSIRSFQRWRTHSSSNEIVLQQSLHLRCSQWSIVEHELRPIGNDVDRSDAFQRRDKFSSDDVFHVFSVGSSSLCGIYSLHSISTSQSNLLDLSQSRQSRRKSSTRSEQTETSLTEDLNETFFLSFSLSLSLSLPFLFSRKCSINRNPWTKRRRTKTKNSLHHCRHHLKERRSTGEGMTESVDLCCLDLSSLCWKAVEGWISVQWWFGGEEEGLIWPYSSLGMWKVMSVQCVGVSSVVRSDLLVCSPPLICSSLLLLLLLLLFLVDLCSQRKRDHISILSSTVDNNNSQDVRERQRNPALENHWSTCRCSSSSSASPFTLNWRRTNHTYGEKREEQWAMTNDVNYGGGEKERERELRWPSG